MIYQSFFTYFHEVQRKVITSQLVKQDNVTLKTLVDKRDKWRGAIVGEINFIKGGKLKIKEEVEINPVNDKVNVLRYSYAYSGIYKENPDFFFRYEMDIDASFNEDGSKRKDHPECHLHANDHDLRYMTHKTNLDEILDFIEACF